MSETRTPTETLAAGYAASGESPRAARRRRELAATYRPNPRLDGLLALRERDPAAFARVTSPLDVIALGSYQAAKQAYKEVNGGSDDE